MPANTIQKVLLKLVICEPDALKTGCWEWRGRKVQGYGQTCMMYRNRFVHRLVYEHFVGPVPEGLQLDHLCRNRCCANFEHLEAVTQSVNVRRSQAPEVARNRQLSKTHCKQGHPYDETNTYHHPGGGRVCRACTKASGERYRERKSQGVT